MYATDIQHDNPTLSQKLAALYQLNTEKRINLSGQSPYPDLLEALGNPHLHLPPTIHVAGTNGKGSTIAFLRAILEQSGYRVHVYSSPHLRVFNERIVLAGEMIGDALLESLLDEAMRLNADAPATFFEITTAIAFAAFARTQADILLLETGLGGRLDCTNVIPAPLLSIITNIGYDHMEFLGDTIQKIASEKAGIIKPGTPCILAIQDYAEAQSEIRNAADSNGATLTECTAPLDQDYVLSLEGAHQRANACTALHAAHLLKAQKFTRISDETIRGGLKSAHWPARLQALNPNGFSLPPHWVIRLDGGHNESAALALRPTLEAWRESGAEIHLVTAMLNRRDPQPFLDPILPLIDHITACPIPDEPQSHDPETILEAARATIPDPARLHSAPDPFSAVTQVKAISPVKECVILIAGSLYLAGWILKHLSPTT